eukprot:COSAG04_NODE_10714_length_757_cov_1.541033_2_plen_30_part_01
MLSILQVSPGQRESCVPGKKSPRLSKPSSQ